MDRVRITVTFDSETYRKLCAGTRKPGLMETYQNQI